MKEQLRLNLFLVNLEKEAKWLSIHKMKTLIQSVHVQVLRESRVKNVVDELNGEMIDIIEWSSDPVVFISHALSPSTVMSVTINEEEHSALVIVPDDQLSLAIGKRGQNARLAVRLTDGKLISNHLVKLTNQVQLQKNKKKLQLMMISKKNLPKK